MGPGDRPPRHAGRLLLVARFPRPVGDRFHPHRGHRLQRQRRMHGRLLPQFVPAGERAFAPLLLLGLLFCSMTFVWLTAYALVVSRAQGFLRRTGVKRAVEAVTGTVLVALGLRLAAER